MVDSFAQAADVEARWRPLTPSEVATADVLTEDASEIIRSKYPDVDARLASGALRMVSLTRVVANMVKRAMIAGDAEGLSSQQQAAGPFSVNQTFSNPNGNLYLTADDIRLLDGEQPRAKVGWLA